MKCDVRMCSRDKLPDWVHAKNVMEVITGDSFGLAFSDGQASLSTTVSNVIVTWRQLLKGISVYCAMRGSPNTTPSPADANSNNTATCSKTRHEFHNSLMEQLFVVRYSVPFQVCLIELNFDSNTACLLLFRLWKRAVTVVMRRNDRWIR